MTIPFYIQKAADLNLINLDNGVITASNTDAINTVMSTVRLVEKLQPSTIADRDETVTQESIVLCRVLASASGMARELWSQLRTAFGVGHGQELPANLWSMAVLRAIAKEIDLTFIGERTGKIISSSSLITSYENLPRSELEVPFSDFCTTISELSSPATMQAFGDAESEWNTALDILKQKRVNAIYKDTLYQASQYLKTDPNLEKALEFVHGRMMEGIGMLSGSIGNQCQVVDLTEAIAGDPGAGRLNWADYILNAKNQDKPISTGVNAFDLDIEGGVTPPRPHMPRAGRLMVIGARTGIGKCLGFGTPVIMADGSVRPVQQIEANDIILGPDGHPRRVHGVVKGQSEMYKVTQLNGDSYIVNDEHILSLRVSGSAKNSIIIDSKRYYGGDIINIHIKDYLALSQSQKYSLKGWKSEAVSFFRFSQTTVPLTPYLAGAYLGDGCSRSPRLYLSDQEIIEALTEFCATNDYVLNKRDDKGCICCSISTKNNGSEPNPVLNWIRNCDFVNKGKYIPEELKFSSIKDRFDLLAGIIDTDGCISNNRVDLILKQSRFANDVVFVARSLGLSATISECIKTIKNRNFSGKYYRITISGETSRIPTKVPRKQCSQRKQIKNPLNTGISVTSVGMGDYYGFALIGPDRLFLLGDFTVTHNTALGVHVACSLASGGLKVGFVSAELDSRAIEARIIANLSKSLIQPVHWKNPIADGLGYVTVGELELPGATKAQSKVAQIVATVAQRLEERGGKILVESPWGACVDTCINTMRSMKARDPELRAVVIDHFHALARHKGGSLNNPSAMLEDRAYKLMTAAKELDIDLFVLAQLNRVGMDAAPNAEPQLNEIRGTDALAHVAHATWLIRRMKGDGPDDPVSRHLEVWHSKVRGRQALWKEGEGILESIKGFHEKSIISIDYETASIKEDSTISDILRKKTSMGL